MEADDVDISIVPEPSAKHLSVRQEQDYRHHRKVLVDWLLEEGKSPDENVGYSAETVKRTAARVDKFYRWVWEREGRYTSRVTHELAEEYIDEISSEDYSDSHLSNTVKALKRMFRWRARRRSGERWDSDATFSSNDSPSREYLTREERHKVREAALKHGSVPPKEELSDEEVSRTKSHLAQRFRKPKEEITDADWRLANNWRIPSLVLASLDAALRPVEVRRARVSWLDLDNGVLRIPAEEASKSDEGWETALTERTVDAFGRWLEERDEFDAYEDTDRVWLTLNGNPFSSKALKDVLTRLCDEAGIDTDDRSVSWYSIRRSTATYLIHEYDLSAAQTQLRHKSPVTTMRYDQTPVEERRDALEQI
jgi:integrase